MGQLLFYILWPILWFYTPLTRRARVLVISEGKVLVVRNKLGPSKWQLPGGGIKFGESVEEAASRELLEELHLVTATSKVINAEPVTCAQFGLLFRLHFVNIIPEKSFEIIPQISEIAAYEWMPISELSNVAREVVVGLNLAESNS